MHLSLYSAESSFAASSAMSIHIGDHGKYKKKKRYATVRQQRQINAIHDVQVHSGGAGIELKRHGYRPFSDKMHHIRTAHAWLLPPSFSDRIRLYSYRWYIVAVREKSIALANRKKKILNAQRTQFDDTTLFGERSEPREVNGFSNRHSILFFTLPSLSKIMCAPPRSQHTHQRLRIPMKIYAETVFYSKHHNKPSRNRK